MKNFGSYKMFSWYQRMISVFTKNAAYCNIALEVINKLIKEEPV